MAVNDGTPFVGWDNIRDINDGPNYFYLHKGTSNTDTIKIDMKWNNSTPTETYYIEFTPDTTLEPAP
jgi:hypothetical protein